MADRFFITLEDDTLFDVQYYAAHERSFSKVYWTENKSAATSFACEALAQSVLSEIKKIAAKSRCSDSATISILKESGAVQNKAEPKPPEPEPPPETHERESAPPSKPEAQPQFRRRAELFGVELLMKITADGFEYAYRIGDGPMYSLGSNGEAAVTAFCKKCALEGCQRIRSFKRAKM